MLFCTEAEVKDSQNVTFETQNHNLQQDYTAPASQPGSTSPHGLLAYPSPCKHANTALQFITALCVRQNNKSRLTISPFSQSRMGVWALGLKLQSSQRGSRVAPWKFFVQFYTIMLFGAFILIQFNGTCNRN